MKVVKVFNNNVALVLNDSNHEEIIMGKGVGFGKREHDTIDQSKIEKRFVLFYMVFVIHIIPKILLFVHVFLF